MQTLEKVIEANVVKYAWDTAGVEGIKMNTLGRASLPDRMFPFHHGHVLWIEFKKLGEEPRPAQWQEIERLRGLGQSVAVCDSREDGRAVIEWAKLRFTQQETIDTLRPPSWFEAAHRCLNRGPAKALASKTLPATGCEVRPKQRVRGYMGRPRSR